MNCSILTKEFSRSGHTEESGQDVFVTNLNALKYNL